MCRILRWEGISRIGAMCGRIVFGELYDPPPPVFFVNAYSKGVSKRVSVNAHSKGFRRAIFCGNRGEFVVRKIKELEGRDGGRFHDAC